MSNIQEHSSLLEEMDSVDSYFECITECSLEDEGAECVTRCVEVHLKQETE